MERRWRNTSVWWDLENCKIPRGCDPSAITTNITSALSDANYDGPSQIFAYADVTRMSFRLFRALSNTGVSVIHVPPERKVSEKILADMLWWGLDHPAPANYLLISDDTFTFSDALIGFRDRKYTTLLALSQPNLSATTPLMIAANNIWCWKSLSAGGAPIPVSQLIYMSRQSDEAVSSPPSPPPIPGSLFSDSDYYDTD